MAHRLLRGPSRQQAVMADRRTSASPAMQERPGMGPLSWTPLRSWHGDQPPSRPAPPCPAGRPAGRWRQAMRPLLALLMAAVASGRGARAPVPIGPVGTMVGPDHGAVAE